MNSLIDQRLAMEVPMQTQIHYGHIGRTEALENFVEQHLEQLIRKSAATDDFRFEVWLENVNGIHSSGAPLFKTSIRAISPRGEEIFVRKEDESFFRAFKKCQDGVLRKLRRSHEAKKRHGN